MWRSPEPRYDVASALCQGGRDYQEDAIVTDFPFGSDSGVVVLADGMGGHAAGDVASKIVVTEVFSELKFQSANFHEFEKDIPGMMTSAAAGANACVCDPWRSCGEIRLSERSVRLGNWRHRRRVIRRFTVSRRICDSKDPA